MRLISGGLSVNQRGLGVNCTIIQLRIPDAGNKQVDCRKSHNLAVDMNGGEGRCDDVGLRRIVKSAQVYIAGNRNAKLAQCLERIYGHKVIGADKYVRQLLHSIKLF